MRLYIQFFSKQAQRIRYFAIYTLNYISWLHRKTCFFFRIVNWVMWIIHVERSSRYYLWLSYSVLGIIWNLFQVFLNFVWIILERIWRICVEVILMMTEIVVFLIMISLMFMCRWLLFLFVFGQTVPQLQDIDHLFQLLLDKRLSFFLSLDELVLSGFKFFFICFIFFLLFSYIHF